MVVVSFAVAYALATTLALLVTWRAVRLHPRQSATWLAIAMAGVSWWSFMKFLEALVFEQSIRILFTALHWIGVGIVSIGVLGFGLALTGRTTWLTRPRIALLSILPALTVVAWLGDPRVVELLRTATPLPATLLIAFEAVEATWSWLRWVSLVYLWLLVATGSLFVLETALERPRLDPSRMLLGIMVIVPWSVNISYEVGVIPFTGFDPTVLGFVVTGVAGLAAIDRFRLFDVPFARSQIVEQFSTPILIYGRDHRLYDYNQQAVQLLDVDADDLDTDIRDILTDTPVQLPEGSIDGDEPLTATLDGTRVSISGADDEPRHFLVQVAALGDDRTQDIGYTLQLTEVTEQYQQREQLRRERNLKDLLRSVLVRLSSRDDLEQAFCDHLASDDRYSLVGICERSTDGGLDARTFASGQRSERGLGTDTYDSVELPSEPGLTALETGEMTIERGISSTNTDGATAFPSAFDIRAAAAISITHNDLTYGVLVVCSSRPDAFDTDEQRLLAELGESVAFSISVVEQREALRGEHVREVIFEVTDSDHHLLSVVTEPERPDTDTTISVDEVGSATDSGTDSTTDTTETERGSLLQYLTVDGLPAESVLTQLNAHPEVESATVLSDDEETASLRVVVRPPSIASLVTDVGGVVRSIDVTDGGVTVVGEFSTRVDMNRVLAHLREVYPETAVLSMLTTEPDPVEPKREQLRSLTSKQRQALEAAYHGGFFERPQRQTAEEIATGLGVSRATFLRHVRAGEAELIETMLTDQERTPVEPED